MALTLETLYKRDKSGKKVLVYDIDIEKANVPNDSVLFGDGVYKVIRKASFLGGKVKENFDEVKKGLQKRTVLEQAELKARSYWNKKRDDSYKTLKELEGEAIKLGLL